MNLRHKIERLKEKRNSEPAAGVFRGMATLALGSVAAKVIGVVSIPLLARLYSPEDFGILAVFNALIFILAPFATLRFVLAIPLPKTDGAAINIVSLCIFLALTMSLLIGIIFCISGQYLLPLLSMEVLTPYWWLVMLGVLGFSIYEILSLWATRKRAYTSIAKTTASQSLFGNLTKVILGILSIKPLGLIVGQIVLSSGGAFSLWLSFKNDLTRNLRCIRLSRIKFFARRYKSFPVYRLPSQFLLVFSIQAPILFFSGMYSAHDTGQLSMAFAVIALPFSVLGQSISKAYYAEIATIGLKNPDKLRGVTQAVTTKLFVLSLLPCLILTLKGEFLFSVVLGEKWADGGQYASLLSIFIIAQFITSPVMNIFNVLERQGVFLVINLIRVLMVILVFWGIAPFWSLMPDKTILIYSIAMTCFYGAMYGYVVYQIKLLPKR